MKYGYITESNDPLVVFQERRKIDFLNNPNRSVTTPGTNNRFGIGVVNGFLKVGGTLQIRSGILKVFIENVLPHHHVITFVLQQFNSGEYFVFLHFSGWRYNPDTVAGL
jgi:hypothetical protein